MIRRSAIFILKADLADLAARPTDIDPAIELRWVEPGERHLITDSPYRPSNRSGPRFFDRHYADDGKACAAFVDGDLVAWRLFKPLFQRTFYWLEIRGTQKVVFGLSAFTAPQARGQRLMAMLTAHAAREYLALGYTTLMATVDCDNEPALAAHTHIGMQRTDKIQATRWPTRFRTIRVNGKLTAGFFKRDRPMVHHAS